MQPLQCAYWFYFYMWFGNVKGWIAFEVGAQAIIFFCKCHKDYLQLWKD